MTEKKSLLFVSSHRTVPSNFNYLHIVHTLRDILQFPALVPPPCNDLTVLLRDTFPFSYACSRPVLWLTLATLAVPFLGRGTVRESLTLVSSALLLVVAGSGTHLIGVVMSQSSHRERHWRLQWYKGTLLQCT